MLRVVIVVTIALCCCFRSFYVFLVELGVWCGVLWAVWWLWRRLWRGCGLWRGRGRLAASGRVATAAVLSREAFYDAPADFADAHAEVDGLYEACLRLEPRAWLLGVQEDVDIV